MATKKDVISVQDQLKAELAHLKDRVDPPSGYLIGTKGKVFSMPDGSSNNGPMTVVVLDWCTANTYFEGLYNPQNIQPPACFALSNEPAKAAPSNNSPKKQAESCSECPKNAWGSDPQGGKGKACKNTRRLLLAAANSTDKSPLWIISVSPTGLKHFDKYVNTLADAGVHPVEVITSISFEASEAYPTLRFEVLEKHDELNVMWKLKEMGQEILYQEPRLEKAA